MCRIPTLIMLLTMKIESDKGQTSLMKNKHYYDSHCTWCSGKVTSSLSPCENRKVWRFWTKSSELERKINLWHWQQQLLVKRVANVSLTLQVIVLPLLTYWVFPEHLTISLGRGTSRWNEKDPEGLFPHLLLNMDKTMLTGKKVFLILKYFRHTKRDRELCKHPWIHPPN